MIFKQKDHLWNQNGDTHVYLYTLTYSKLCTLTHTLGLYLVLLWNWGKPREQLFKRLNIIPPSCLLKPIFIMTFANWVSIYAMQKVVKILKNAKSFFETSSIFCIKTQLYKYEWWTLCKLRIACILPLLKFLLEDNVIMHNHHLAFFLMILSHQCRAQWWKHWSWPTPGLR